jgi:hypothetical protein
MFPPSPGPPATTLLSPAAMPMKLREDLVPQRLHVVFVRKLVQLCMTLIYDLSNSR